VTHEPGYATPVALRFALTDRLRTLAAGRPGRSLQDLLRQFAYDRLLYRVFSGPDSDRWVLKGATALLARLGGDARHTVDVDLYDRSGTLEEAELALRSATSREVSDQFRFILSPGRRIAQGGISLRVSVTAFLGATEFARFNVDLVAGTGMSGEPDEADPLVPVELAGVPRTRYRLYPLADHIADKVLAIVERHSRTGVAPVASTRYRDLADLVVIARRESIEASAALAALRQQADRRGISLPNTLRLPRAGGWAAGYARVARDIPDINEKDLSSATDTVSRFIDPVLQGVARGRWSPDRGSWM
jgi:hypothetical protein